MKQTLSELYSSLMYEAKLLEDEISKKQHEMNKKRKQAEDLQKLYEQLEKEK